jgi:hypothetical protein
MGFFASTKPMQLASLLVTLFLVFVPTTPFEWSVSSSRNRPEVNRRAIAGLWRLTPRSLQHTLPLKEFTTYPKVAPQAQPVESDLLLMLKEDGSFQQYLDSDQDETTLTMPKKDLDQSWSTFTARKQYLHDVAKGVWDFVDGKLILAADRPDVEKTRDDAEKPPDTLLVGRVVATYEQSLAENPMLAANDSRMLDVSASGSKNTTLEKAVLSAEHPSQTQISQLATNNQTDAHLSVPKGSVKVGRFFYPKSHPSFFETPMFHAVKRGSFVLRQVLGSLNTQHGQNDLVEKFHRENFYNKSFWLTSHPIGQQNNRPKGEKRWSIKYNKYVYDAPRAKSSSQSKQDVEKDNRGTNIRVMQVHFYPNGTFSTLAGLGDSTILRGKYDVVGQDRDQLWMQIWRFGFGRDVSGSTYSEGRMLNQDDAKMYWGRIEEDAERISAVEEELDGEVGQKMDSKRKRLLVQGSVLVGSGLEPLPVGRFILREMEDESMLRDDSYQDDDDDHDDDDQDDLPSLRQTSSRRPIDDTDSGIDWSGGAAFE